MNHVQIVYQDNVYYVKMDICYFRINVLQYVEIILLLPSLNNVKIII